MPASSAAPSRMGRKQVGVVVRVDARHHRRDALEAGAGVDRRLGQRRRAGRGALELHEDEVPDLEIAPRVGPLVPRDLRLIRTPVDVDLAARAAGAGLAHRPEIVLLAAAHDPIGRQTRDPPPEIEGLVVLLEHGGEQMRLRQSPDARHQVPAPLDRLFLEVVAEREVAEHLEEGVVARAGPDVLEVVVLARDAQALLHRHRPAEVGLRGAGEVVLELDHAGVGEQQRGIPVGHQRRAGQGAVAALREEIHETPPDVGALHRTSRFPGVDFGSGGAGLPRPPITPRRAEGPRRRPRTPSKR